MLKRIVSIIICVFLVGGIFLIPSYADDMASVRNKKIVAVVYDDSGSMMGDNWAYACYAMQAFTAMLNKEDDLYLVYMSDPQNCLSIPTSNLIQAVTDVRNHNISGGTPFDSVKTAISRLKGINESDPNAQFWLVVFTDGAFDEDLPGVEKTLNSFSKEKMKNGSEPQIMYMTIGDFGDNYTPKLSQSNISVLTANDSKEIVDRIFDISSKVSGRYRVEDKDITIVDDKTIKVSANIPLLNIGILTQNTETKVVDVKTDEGVSVPIKADIPISSPDASNNCVSGASDEALSMHGRVALAGEDGKNIPAGNYIVTFSDKIAKENLVIMFEPALRLRITLYCDDVEVDDFDSITTGMTNLSAKAELYEAGTDNVVLLSLLPGGVSTKTEHFIDDQLIEDTKTLEINPLTVNEGDHSVVATLDLPGYFHLESSVSFTPTSFVIDSITAELSYDGSPRRQYNDGTSDGDNVVYITHLKDNKTGIKFTVSANGAPIDKTQALAMQGSFAAGLNVKFKNYLIEVQDDGSFLVYPSKKPWFMLTMLYYALHHGDQNIGVDMAGVQAAGTLDFKLFYSWQEVVIPIIAPIILLYLIWWFLFKKHFPGETLLFGTGYKVPMDSRFHYSEDDSVELNWVGSFRRRNPILFLIRFILMFLPFPAQVRFNGFVFVGQKSFVKRGETQLVVRKVKGKAVSASNQSPMNSWNQPEINMNKTLYFRDGNAHYKFWIEE